ncbi:hypothetical protein BJ508DRAFT_417053 [Ascobolus immersus RN42]|uniref:Rhodopsin domain-containing protein n=1 Tax=Ascobolus immersus RN42 TaxID=1160509 RepID=A0A3N4HWG7_ASCIM|nr:hypothetical protein BJ508DRAFT_417053 [Ascobolus immersus RN42]
MPLKQDASSRTVITLNIILPSVSLAFLLVRNFSRIWYLRVTGWDDLLFNIGWVFTAALNAAVCYSAKMATDIEGRPFTKSDGIRALQLLWIVQVTYLLSNFFVKSAYLAFSARLASTGIYFKASRAALIFNCCLFTGCLFAGIFGCTPVNFFWDRSIKGGTCINIRAFYLANAFLNAFMDIITLVIPVCIIWTSPALTLQKKARISALFFLGTMTCICSIMRIPGFVETLSQGRNTDWNLRESTTWSVLEVNVAIVTGCIPAIKPLIGAMLGHATPMGSGRNRGPQIPGVGQSGRTDAWAMRRHEGDYHASVTAEEGGLHGRGCVNKRRAMNGDHIVLEETLTVEDGRWDTSSSQSILSSTSPPKQRSLGP